MYHLEKVKQTFLRSFFCLTKKSRAQKAQKKFPPMSGHVVIQKKTSVPLLKCFCSWSRNNTGLKNESLYDRRQRKAEWKYIIFVTDNNDNKRHLNLVQRNNSIKIYVFKIIFYIFFQTSLFEELNFSLCKGDTSHQAWIPTKLLLWNKDLNLNFQCQYFTFRVVLKRAKQV